MARLTGRPTQEDTEALELLLANDRLSEWAAGFVESLASWEGDWTEKQCVAFDDVCEVYL